MIIILDFLKQKFTIRRTVRLVNGTSACPCVQSKHGQPTPSQTAKATVSPIFLPHSLCTKNWGSNLIRYAKQRREAKQSIRTGHSVQAILENSVVQGHPVRWHSPAPSDLLLRPHRLRWQGGEILLLVAATGLPKELHHLRREMDPFLLLAARSLPFPLPCSTDHHHLIISTREEKGGGIWVSVWF